MWKRKKNLGEQRNQSLFKEKSPRILQPCDSRHCAPHSAAPEPACLCTTTARDGGEDADFSACVLLRLRAATPPEHALSSSARIQQVQGGTGEWEDASFVFCFNTVAKSTPKKKKKKKNTKEKFPLQQKCFFVDGAEGAGLSERAWWMIHSFALKRNLHCLTFFILPPATSAPLRLLNTHWDYIVRTHTIADNSLRLFPFHFAPKSTIHLIVCGVAFRCKEIYRHVQPISSDSSGPMRLVL